MDNTLNQYRSIVIQLLTEYYERTKIINEPQEIEKQLIIDQERDHYQILTVGWKGTNRLYWTTFHIDIKDNKIWVQEDATDADIVGQLEEYGIPKKDIVLAFHAPQQRKLTAYAMA